MALARRSAWPLSLLLSAVLTAGAGHADAADPGFPPGAGVQDLDDLRERAASGSFDAMLHLGLAYDVGLGVPRDAAAAYEWYLKAANAGHPDGQFNVAVMLDRGATADEASKRAAGIWYARAAANGQARAQYALAMIYDAGDGVPRNPDVATYWYEQAAAKLPAAAEKLASRSLDRSVVRSLDAPQLLSGEIVEIENRTFVEMVWTAAPGPEGARFLVEIASLAPDGSAWMTPPVSIDTAATSFVMDFDGNPPAFAWRVTQFQGDGSDYASSDWTKIGETALPLPAPTRPADLPASVMTFQQTLKDLVRSSMQ